MGLWALIITLIKNYVIEKILIGCISDLAYFKQLKKSDFIESNKVTLLFSLKPNLYFKLYCIVGLNPSL
jgi:hypothetical protein